MFDEIESNIHKSWLLLGFFIVLILGLGYVVGRLFAFGYVGVVIAAVLALGAAWGSYYYSDAVVLSISGAREVSHEENPFLHNTVEGLAIAAGIPKPRVYVINDPAPNAFATGRDPEHAAIAVTQGLLDKMNRQELEGVLAHEMSHVENFDIRFSSLVVVLVGMVALLSDFFWRDLRYGGRRSRENSSGLFMVGGLVLAILAPIIAQLIQLAISRRREYLADVNGARLTRNPEGLASALEKLEADQAALAVANKATAHLYIVNPLHDWGGKLNGLFDTHPPIEDRIRRLRVLEGISSQPFGGPGTPGATVPQPRGGSAS